MLDLPHLDAMSRRAQERLLLESVAREIKSNLGTIETALDAFLPRQQQAGGAGPTLQAPIRQIQGALLVLGQDRANAVLAECAAPIERFAQPGFARPGRRVRGCGQETLGPRILRHPVARRCRRHRRHPGTAAASPGPRYAKKPNPSPRRPWKRPLRRPSPKPLQRHRGHRRQLWLRQSRISDGTGNRTAAGAGCRRNRAPTKVCPTSKSKVSKPRPNRSLPRHRPSSRRPAPSAEAERLIEASEEDLDAELLGIFLEEANEVLGTINQNLPMLHAAPAINEVLVTVRRSFHTLKGSGRMVGLAELGEAGWGVEQVLNAWLHDTKPASPGLLEMLDHRRHAVCRLGEATRRRRQPASRLRRTRPSLRGPERRRRSPGRRGASADSRGRSFAAPGRGDAPHRPCRSPKFPRARTRISLPELAEPIATPAGPPNPWPIPKCLSCPKSPTEPESPPEPEPEAEPVPEAEAEAGT
jgi:chemosensory pili system protein ChpA (sensor histidine kinase/response regulator)